MDIIYLRFLVNHIFWVNCCFQVYQKRCNAMKCNTHLWIMSCKFFISFPWNRLNKSRYSSFKIQKTSQRISFYNNNRNNANTILIYNRRTEALIFIDVLHKTVYTRRCFPARLLYLGKRLEVKTVWTFYRHLFGLSSSERHKYKRAWFNFVSQLWSEYRVSLFCIFAINDDVKSVQNFFQHNHTTSAEVLSFADFKIMLVEIDNVLKYI